MKKTAAVRLAACLVAVSVVGSPLASWADPAPAPPALSAKEAATPAPKPADSSIPLEKAIAMAKEKVPVPGDLDMFSSDYQEYGGKGRWMLRWYSGKEPGSSMNITLDAATGDLENLNFYRAVTPGTRYQGLPSFSRDQCLEIARKEGARLIPDRFSQTVPVQREDRYQPMVIRDRDYPIIYDFNFRRTSSGISVADQGINVGVNAETGEVVRFDCNWDSESKLPSPEGRVSTDRARQIFLEKAGLELTYYMTGQTSPDTPGELKLVYRPKPPGRFILNALTGQPVDTREMDLYFDEMGGGGGGDMMLSKKQAAMSMTPAETRAVQETKDFLSSESAQEAARKAVDIPGEYTVTGRSLERYYGVPGSRVWTITFSGSDKKKPVRVSVDAKSGALVSFNRDQGFDAEDIYKEPQVKLSQDQAQKIAGDLVSRLQPGKSGQVELRQTEPEIGPWVKLGKVVPRGYMFSYARKVNGIVYPENGFRVRVSASDGEVLSYDMIWWETSFPKADGVIDAGTVNEKYLADHPLALEYGRGYKRWVREDAPPEYYLAYHLTGPMGGMVDAVTGQEIDYMGNPVVKKGKQPFSDISGHPAEADINLLAGEGILSGDGGEFRPDDPATGAEVLAMLVKATRNQGPYRPLDVKAQNDPWYRQVVESATAGGILDGDFTVDPEGAVTRLELARLGINAGGWGKLARLSQIFRLEVSDAGSIPEDFRGYVAAALGLDLMSADGGKFSPDGGLTRGEAATFLAKLLQTK